MRRKSFLMLLVLAIVALLLASGCATKKFVRQEIATSETKLSQKIDQGDSKLQGQITELSTLNKQLSSRVEQVSDKAAAADAKAEEAKGIGNDAKRSAEGANQAVGELRVRFDGRNNYVVTETKAVLFAFNKSDLTAEAKTTIDTLLKDVAGSKNALIALEGYTDKVGSDQYNFTLSEKRVASVVRYMVSEKGVELQRIFTVGLGKNNPVADNKTADGRKQNRRVTIKVLEVK